MIRSKSVLSQPSLTLKWTRRRGGSASVTPPLSSVRVLLCSNRVPSVVLCSDKHANLSHSFFDRMSSPSALSPCGPTPTQCSAGSRFGAYYVCHIPKHDPTLPMHALCSAFVAKVCAALRRGSLRDFWSYMQLLPFFPSHVARTLRPSVRPLTAGGCGAIAA